MIPGQKLGNYAIVRQLGAGGMGEVYLARDPRLDRFIAIKILPRGAASDQDRRRRFVGEAKAASALNHPNVATIYDVGEAEAIPYIAMEYVEGETLAQRMAGGRLPTGDALDIAAQAAGALTAAHAKGIIHRDVKPANLMITPQGQAKVLDFGLAKFDNSRLFFNDEAPTAAGTLPGMVMGTIHYMSPEQLLGRALDARTDVFSFGVVLYEMFAGRHPFIGSTSTRR